MSQSAYKVENFTYIATKSKWVNETTLEKMITYTEYTMERLGFSDPEE